MPHDVFLSHAAEDKAIAGTICDALEAQGIACWIAPRDNQPGLPYGAGLVEAISESKAIVLVFSEHSNRSSQVLREIERAVAKDLHIVPFRIQDVPLSLSMEYFISSSNWLDATNPPRKKDLDALCQSLRLLLPRFRARASNVGSPPASEEFCESDLKMLDEFYGCFDRPAFRMAFEHEADLDGLMHALQDTIASVNTGVKRRRDGVVFGEAVKGKSYFKNDFLRQSFDRVVDLLAEALSTYARAWRLGYFHGRGFYGDRPMVAFHMDHLDEVTEIGVKINDLRNQALTLANAVYVRVGKQPFPLIKDP